MSANHHDKILPLLEKTRKLLKEGREISARHEIRTTPTLDRKGKAPYKKRGRRLELRRPDIRRAKSSIRWIMKDMKRFQSVVDQFTQVMDQLTQVTDQLTQVMDNFDEDSHSTRFKQFRFLWRRARHILRLHGVRNRDRFGRRKIYG